MDLLVHENQTLTLGTKIREKNQLKKRTTLHWVKCKGNKNNWNASGIYNSFVVTLKVFGQNTFSFTSKWEKLHDPTTKGVTLPSEQK